MFYDTNKMDFAGGNMRIRVAQILVRISIQMSADPLRVPVTLLSPTVSYAILNNGEVNSYHYALRDTVDAALPG